MEEEGELGGGPNLLDGAVLDLGFAWTVSSVVSHEVVYETGGPIAYTATLEGGSPCPPG